MPQQISKFIEANGLKLKFYVIKCTNHTLSFKRDYFERDPRYGLNNNSTIFANLKFPPYETCTDIKVNAIFEELATNSFTGYSCVMIVINTECKCRTSLLQNTFLRIQQNKNLRYKSKLIISMYKRKSIVNRNILSKAFFKIHVSNLPNQSNFLHPKNSIEIQYPSRSNIGRITKDSIKSITDTINFMHYQLENAIFLQVYIQQEYEIGTDIESIFDQLCVSPMFSIQIILMKNIQIINDFRLIQATTNADLYFYNINPALIIIIDDHHFTKKYDVRFWSRKLQLKQITESNHYFTPKNSDNSMIIPELKDIAVDVFHMLIKYNNATHSQKFKNICVIYNWMVSDDVKATDAFCSLLSCTNAKFPPDDIKGVCYVGNNASGNKKTALVKFSCKKYKKLFRSLQGEINRKFNTKHFYIFDFCTEKTLELFEYATSLQSLNYAVYISCNEVCVKKHKEYEVYKAKYKENVDDIKKSNTVYKKIFGKLSVKRRPFYN